VLKKTKKIDFLYIPKFNHIYEDKKKSKINIDKKDKILCAKFRKGHFEGVLDVMNRLTNLIKPKKIFMGEKDFQQYLLVKKFIENKFKSKIISSKTIRDKNKLALSSRNNLLNKSELEIARKITRRLFLFKKKIKNIQNFDKILLKEKKEIQKKFSIKIEYLEIRNKKNLLKATKLKNSKIFISYYINDVRLIDNF